MKLNFKMFKSRPVIWGLVAIVIFAVFYYLYSHGASSSSSSGTVTTIGPSDAQVAAQMQYGLGMAQIQAQSSAAESSNNAQVAVATLAAQSAIAQTQAQADVAKYTVAQQAATQQDYYSTQQAITAQQGADAVKAQQIQANYGIATAQIAAQSIYDQANLQATEFSQQLQTNQNMFTEQIKAANFQSLVAQVPSLAARDRDEALAILTQANAGAVPNVNIQLNT